MKIAHALGWYFPDSLGGTEVYVAALSKHLKTRGHDVLIAAPDPKRDAETTYEHEGVEVYRYPIPAEPTRDEAQGRVPARGSESFHRWLGRARPDVFHCHSLVTGLGLHEIEVAKSLGARVVVTCHTPSLGYICQRGTMMRWGRELCDGLTEPVKCAACELQHRGLAEPLARAVARVPEGLSRAGAWIPGPAGTALGMRALIADNVERQRALLATADAFVVLTDWARRTVAANHGSEEKLVLNRLGVEVDARRSAGKATVPIRLGYVGRFDPLKGVLVLADAVARLPHDLRFTLEFRGPAVDDRARDTLVEIQHLLSANERVRFAEPVSHASMRDVLAGYDVLICPSVCLEGGPTVALEARAVGTPVLGSRIGGLAEIVADGVDGALVPPADVAALAAALERLAREPEIANGWRENLRPSRTMEDVAEGYLEIYGERAEANGRAVRIG